MSVIGTPLVAPPYWVWRNTVTSYTFNVINPVEAGPQQFERLVQRQIILVTDDTTLYSFSFDVKGGVGLLSGGYPNNDDPTANYFYIDDTQINCTVNQLFPNIIQVDTPFADSGGRTYLFTFSPFVGVKPTIQKSVTNPLLGNLTVTVKTIWFAPN